MNAKIQNEQVKTVFITGASSGFGAACAREFAKNGWQLVILGRRKERLLQLKEELQALSNIHIIEIDLKDKEKLIKSLKSLPKSFQNIDVCINNAGLALGLERAFESNINDWEEMVDTNIKGTIYCTHALLPQMVARNQGHIINIGSVAGRLPYPGANVYGATKAFIKMFSDNLKADLLGTPIKVTNIEPGLAESEFSLVRFKGDKEKATNVYKDTKPIRPEDIAQIVFWIASTPSHININAIEIMPVCQAWGPTLIHREVNPKLKS